MKGRIQTPPARMFEMLGDGTLRLTGVNHMIPVEADYVQLLLRRDATQRIITALEQSSTRVRALGNAELADKIAADAAEVRKQCYSFA